MEQKKLGYVEFMQAMSVAPVDGSKCITCGGLGLEPILCCDGRECCCRGMPTDYDTCKCGTKEPSEEQLREWLKTYQSQSEGRTKVKVHEIKL